MKDSTKFFIISNVIPKFKIGALGAAYCLVTATDAVIPTAVVMGILTGYVARWGSNAGRFLGLPLASKTSGMTIQEIREIFRDPAQLRQITRDSIQFNRQMMVNFKANIRSPNRKIAPPPQSQSKCRYSTCIDFDFSCFSRNNLLVT